MNVYKWDEQFYNEIIKDYNYRFPKFNQIPYPNYNNDKQIIKQKENPN